MQSAQLSPELREALGPVDELLGRWSLFRDNPAHRRLRLALTTAFNPALIEALAPPAWRPAVGVRSLEKLPVAISTVLPRGNALAAPPPAPLSPPAPPSPAA